MEKKSREELVQKYTSIIDGEQYVEISDMWFYDVAKRLGFNFDNPDEELIGGRAGNQSAFVYSNYLVYRVKNVRV